MIRVENEWLRIRAVSFVFIYLDLMRNHSFSIIEIKRLVPDKTNKSVRNIFHIAQSLQKMHASQSKS